MACPLVLGCLEPLDCQHQNCIRWPVFLVEKIATQRNDPAVSHPLVFAQKIHVSYPQEMNRHRHASNMVCSSRKSNVVYIPCVYSRFGLQIHFGPAIQRLVPIGGFCFDVQAAAKLWISLPSPYHHFMFFRIFESSLGFNFKNFLQKQKGQK